MEKSKEKTPEQIFGEKLSPTENSPSSDTSVKKDSFPWMQRNETDTDSKHDKHLDDLLARGSKDKNPSSATIPYEVPSLHNYTKSHQPTKNIEFPKVSKNDDNVSKNVLVSTSSVVDQSQQLINSLKEELEEYKHKTEAMQTEIKQYQNIINLLRTELEQHRNEKPQATPSAIIQYQQLINSLRGELQEYKYKTEAMQPEISNYQQIIKSLKSEIAGYKHEKPHTVSEDTTQYQLLINAFRAELAEYKNKVELLSSERNQQNSIDALRAELAEYKKANLEQPSTKYENMIKSLNAEISRLKNNLDSMILK